MFSIISERITLIGNGSRADSTPKESGARRDQIGSTHLGLIQPVGLFLPPRKF